jgi:hypothetical protein
MPAINKVNCFADRRWLPGGLFNSSIADGLKSYAFSIMAAFLICSREERQRSPKDMRPIAYKIEGEVALDLLGRHKDRAPASETQRCAQQPDTTACLNDGLRERLHAISIKIAQQVFDARHDPARGSPR